MIGSVVQKERQEVQDEERMNKENRRRTNLCGRDGVESDESHLTRLASSMPLVKSVNTIPSTRERKWKTACE